MLVFFAIMGLSASTASAMSPSLLLNASQSGTVQIVVWGDAFSQVSMYYSNGQLVGMIGTTDQYGYFSTALGNGYYGVGQGSMVYVTVGGQQSMTVQWPTYFGYNNNYYNNYGYNYQYYPNYYTGAIAQTYPYQYQYQQPVSFSNSNVQLNPGQNMNVSVTGGVNYYISSNSNSNVVSASISGSNIYLNGNQPGSSSISVCAGSYNNSCRTMYVTVGNNNIYYPLYGQQYTPNYFGGYQYGQNGQYGMFQNYSAGY